MSEIIEYPDYRHCPGQALPVIKKLQQLCKNLNYAGDAVDSIIQQVLENGGDVEWVDKDRLKDYGHIALIRYY